MAKFIFTFESLLKARRVTEQRYQRHVAEIEGERMELENRLRTTQRTIAESRRSLQGNLVGRIDAQSLRVHAAASIALMRSAQRMALDLAGVHRRLEAARLELIEAARHRRAIEILRERRLDSWTSAIQKAETIALDELAVINAARTTPSERRL